MPAPAPAPSRPVTAADRRAVAVDQARIAWATAGRDSELDRWHDLYDLAVPRPRSADEDGRAATEPRPVPGHAAAA